MNYVSRLHPLTSTNLPLAVDLDGTLIHADLFKEALLRFVFDTPLRLFQLVLWAAHGRAFLKARLAVVSPCDPTTLPYDQRLVAWLQGEHDAGRTLVLATGADRGEAERVAGHLGLFDAVFASDGDTNFKSQCKADRLRAEYPGGFVYAGDERADLKVWSAAVGAVLVNARASLLREVEAILPVERAYPRVGSRWHALIKAIRPQQWAKNMLIFLALLVGKDWAHSASWTAGFIAFWALSFTASSVYLINDAADISADRRHDRKKSRPFASGALSPFTGLAAAAVLLAIGLTMAAAVKALPWFLLYLATTSIYTFWLKRVVLVDVFLLASLYTLRVIIGGVVTGNIVSDWLLAFSCFFFLNLAFAKRAAELRTASGREQGQLSRRGYFGTDEAVLKMMGICAGFISALVLALYLQDGQVRSKFSEPFLLWGPPAAVVFWVCRTWLMVDRGEMHDDPLIFAFRDKTSLALAFVTAIAFAGAVLMPHGLLQL